MNEPIFNLNQPYTIVKRQQWLPPAAANCMVFNFKWFFYKLNVLTSMSVTSFWKEKNLSVLVWLDAFILTFQLFIL